MDHEQEQYNLRLPHNHRNSYDQPGFRAASTKKNARRVLKKQENPAPIRVREPITFEDHSGNLQNHGGSSDSRQGKSGVGNALRRAEKKLITMENASARPRRILRLKNKIVKLKAAIERKAALEKENENV